MTLGVRMGYYRVRIVFGIVRSLVVPVLVGTSFVHRFVKGILPSKQKIVLYISKPVPLLAIKDMPEETRDKNKAQAVLVVEENTSRLL